MKHKNSEFFAATKVIDARDNFHLNPSDANYARLLKACWDFQTHCEPLVLVAATLLTITQVVLNPSKQYASAMDNDDSLKAGLSLMSAKYPAWFDICEKYLNLAKGGVSNSNSATDLISQGFLFTAQLSKVLNKKQMTLLLAFMTWFNTYSNCSDTLEGI